MNERRRGSPSVGIKWGGSEAVIRHMVFGFRSRESTNGLRNGVRTRRRRTTEDKPTGEGRGSFPDGRRTRRAAPQGVCVADEAVGRLPGVGGVRRPWGFFMRPSRRSRRGRRPRFFVFTSGRNRNGSGPKAGTPFF